MKVSGGDGVKDIIGNEGVKEMLSQETRAIMYTDVEFTRYPCRPWREKLGPGHKPIYLT